ncbi:MAG: hypothetical protein QM765_38835 [Myxococcales bacterium]
MNRRILGTHSLSHDWCRHQNLAVLPDESLLPLREGQLAPARVGRQQLEVLLWRLLGQRLSERAPERFQLFGRERKRCLELERVGRSELGRPNGEARQLLFGGPTIDEFLPHFERVQDEPLERSRILRRDIQDRPNRRLLPTAPRPHVVREAPAASDDEEAVPDLRDSEVLRREHGRVDGVAELLELGAHDSPRLAAVVVFEVGDVLENEVAGAMVREDACHLVEEPPGRRVVEPLLLSRFGEGLAGEAGAEDVMRGDIFGIDLPDVAGRSDSEIRLV